MTREGPPTLPTRVGRAGYRGHGFSGHALYGELLGQESWGGLFFLAASGRRLAPEARGVLDDLAVALTVADPRIWPLKAVRVAASYGGAAAAYAAGNLLCAEAQLGPHVCEAAARWQLSLFEAYGEGSGGDLSEELRRRLAARAPLPGFGVPFRSEDERVVALRSRLEARGRADGPHWRFFEQLQAILRDLKGLEANIDAALPAVGLDLGLTPREVGVLALALFQHMFLANAAEGAEQAPEILQRLGADRVAYQGPADRVSPRAARVRTARGSPPSPPSRP